LLTGALASKVRRATATYRIANGLITRPLAAREE
jgi:hypothetical protein